MTLDITELIFQVCIGAQINPAWILLTGGVLSIPGKNMLLWSQRRTKTQDLRLGLVSNVLRVVLVLREQLLVKS